MNLSLRQLNERVLLPITRSNLSVNPALGKLRLPDPSVLRAPVAGYLKRRT